MPRPRSLTPKVSLEVQLSELTHTRLTLYLFSEIEARVPLGDYSRFVEARVREYFDHQHLDLAPFTSEPAGAFVVSGSPEAIATLTKTLKGDA